MNMRIQGCTGVYMGEHENTWVNMYTGVYMGEHRGLQSIHG